MSERRALRSRTHALAITGVLALGVFAAIVLAAGVNPAPTRPSASAAALPAVSKNDTAAARRASLPLYFEPNVGQSDPHVRFLSQSSRYSLFLTDDGAVFSLVGGQIHKGPELAKVTVNPPRQPQADRLVESAVRIRMVGANPHPGMTALEPLAGRVNYLIGNDPSKFHRDVPTYGRVRVSDVYPGIDVVYYGMPTSLEYDIVAAPGADTSRIHLAIEGDAKTAIDASGDIEISTAAGKIAVQKPRAYQRAADGSEIPVESSFVATKGTTRPEYSIRLARYDRAHPLIIDPTVQILYSSFLGGAAESTGPVNLEQFAGLTANTPLTVADIGTDVALDPTDKAYITGLAYSGAASFPLKSAFQSTQTGHNSPPNQNPVGFIAKFDTTKSGAASLIYSTYIGGAGDTNNADAGHGNGDLPFGIAVDGSGEAFVVGQTYSSNFPQTSTCGAFGKSNDQKATDVNVGFVAKLNAAGSGIVYACYIDGSNNATEARVALYPAGCDSGTTKCKAYIAGSTQSDHTTGFPVTANAFQNTLATGASGKSNATFIVVHEDGSSLDYATLFGGSGNTKNADAGIGVAVDSTGHGYITGATFSGDLPVKNAAVATYNSGASTKKVSNVYVAEFNPGGSGAASLLYATYLGGSGSTGTITPPFGGPISLSIGDLGTAIRIDPTTGHIWVAGVTASTNFQVPGKVTPVFQSTNQAEANAGPPATAGFITELDPSQAGLNQVRYSTYFGGGGTQITIIFSSGSIGIGDAIVDLETVGGKLYVTGATASGTVTNGFPTNANACQKLNDSSGLLFDGIVSVPITAFASELDPSQSSSGAQLAFSTLLGGTGMGDAGTGLRIDSHGDMVISGLTYSSDFPTTTTAFQSSNAAAGANSTNAFLTVLYPLGTDCTHGGGTPVPTPTTVASPTPTPGKTPTPVATPTPGKTPTPVATPTPPPTPTPIATPTPGGKIALSTGTVVFPKAGFGEAPTASNFLIQNVSAKHRLVGTVEPPTGPFSFGPGSGGSFDLPPLGMLKVKLRFTPAGLGPETGALIILSNDVLHHSPVQVNLQGAGKPGVPTLSVPSLSFGPVGIGIAPVQTRTLKIQNTGLGKLDGTVGPLAAPFAVTTGQGAFGPIAPGGVVIVKVQFTPTAAGPAPTTLVINTDNPGHPTISVPISGTGKPGVLATNVATAPTFTSLPETLVFGKVKQGSLPKALSFKIKNIGIGELQGTVPLGSVPFGVTTNSGAFDLAPGATKKVTVTFVPIAPGHVSVPLTILVTSPGKPPAGITIMLSGKGT